MADVLGVLSSVQQHLAQGRPEQARRAIQSALQRDPTHPDLMNLMAVVLIQIGQQEQALYFAQRAARSRPDVAAYQANLGGLLAVMKRYEEALVPLQRAIAIDPAHINARIALASSLSFCKRDLEAAEHCRVALEQTPDDAALVTKMSLALIRAGQAAPALERARETLRRDPSNLEAAKYSAFLGNYLPCDRGELFRSHLNYARVLESSVPGGVAPFTNAPDPERRLRVGLLSPDLKDHPVSYFIEPYFHHRDRERFDLFCYSTALQEDAVSNRLLSMSDKWLQYSGHDYDELCGRIRADGVDVLIDLAGLTADDRLAVMARRPAPVQVSWIGYPNTTGLATIGYRLVDSLTDPPGSEALCVERLVRLDPCFLCYQAPAQAPEPTLPPAGEPVTFGSFNNLPKIHAGVARVWAAVQRAVPASRLLLKSGPLADPGARAATEKMFAEAGADISRLELLGIMPKRADHLGAYGRVHVALDTFPYNGTTTTCEALWMGVPVVALEGDRHGARVGVSLLNAVGLREWIAPDEARFVELAASLAGDRARLEELRRTLRERVGASALCDGAPMARRLEGALRAMWREYCARAGAA